MKLKKLKEDVRQKMLNGQIEELDLMATVHNLLGVIECKDWERLGKKESNVRISYNRWIEKLNQ